MFILYNYYQAGSNNGVIGIFMVIFIYVGLLVLNAFFFYQYLVYLHMEGRVIDIYSRVSADCKQFFVPIDNEVSAKYLKWVISNVENENKWARCPEEVKKISITYHKVEDDSFKHTITYIAIYRESNCIFFMLFDRK